MTKKLLLLSMLALMLAGCGSEASPADELTETTEETETTDETEVSEDTETIGGTESIEETKAETSAETTTVSERETTVQSSGRAAAASEVTEAAQTTVSDDEPSASETSESTTAQKNLVISLSASATEIQAGIDSGEIIFSAEIPPGHSPKRLELINVDTGNTAAELYDEADYDRYGDTVKGDGVYCCRYTLDTNIDTDPDVSEERNYHFYVTYTENNTGYYSDIVKIWVCEPFTDKELADIVAVDDAISEWISSDEYKNASIEERTELAVAFLTGLADNGTEERPYSLVDKESIFAEGYMVSFNYACGISGGIMVKEFDEYMN